MKEGKVVDSFAVKGKDGEKHEVVFRYPSKKDFGPAVKLINSVRKEAEFLGRTRAETLKSETVFIKKQMDNMKKRKGVFLFVEVGGTLVGDASIQPLDYDVSAHVGKFGIMLKEKFTELGIGSRLFKKMLELAKKDTGFKIIESGYIAKNARSKRFHKKFGFKQYGCFPKGCKLKNGKYCDHISVYKFIKKL